MVLYSTFHPAHHPHGTPSPPAQAAPGTGPSRCRVFGQPLLGQTPHRNALPSSHPLMVPIKPVQTQGKRLSWAQPCREPASSERGVQPVPRGHGRAERDGAQQVSPPSHEQCLAPSTHQEDPREGGQRAQPSPGGYSASGLGKARLPLGRCGAWPGEVPAQAGCRCHTGAPRRARHWGRGAAAGGSGHPHHQCWETRASPWSCSSRGRTASAVMLAKLT